jgi:hypothetical protein
MELAGSDPVKFAELGQTGIPRCRLRKRRNNSIWTPSTPVLQLHTCGRIVLGQSCARNSVRSELLFSGFSIGERKDLSKAASSANRRDAGSCGGSGRLATAAEIVAKLDLVDNIPGSRVLLVTMTEYPL